MDIHCALRLMHDVRISQKTIIKEVKHEDELTQLVHLNVFFHKKNM